MADLRLATKREAELQRRVQAGRAAEDYQQRRARYEVERQLQRAQERVAACRHELAGPGRDPPARSRWAKCSFLSVVNDHEAYFVWFDSHQRPTHWQFADETELRCIPRRWVGQ